MALTCLLYLCQHDSLQTNWFPRAMVLVLITYSFLFDNHLLHSLWCLGMKIVINCSHFSYWVSEALKILYWTHFSMTMLVLLVIAQGDTPCILQLSLHVATSWETLISRLTLSFTPQCHFCALTGAFFNLVPKWC